MNERNFHSDDVGDYIADMAMSQNAADVMLANYGVSVPNIEARLRSLYCKAHDCFQEYFAIKHGPPHSSMGNMSTMLMQPMQPPANLQGLSDHELESLVNDSLEERESFGYGKVFARQVYEEFKADIDCSLAKSAFMLEDLCGRIIRKASCLSEAEGVPDEIRHGILSFSRMLPKHIEFEAYALRKSGRDVDAAAMEMKLAIAKAEHDNQYKEKKMIEKPIEAMENAPTRAHAKVETPPSQVDGDMLVQIFKMQEELNDKTFAKNGLTDGQNYPLTITRIQSDVYNENFGPNHLPCLWLRNYLTAMEHECEELRAELPWKFWSKDKINMQNIRVEIIDQLHFLVSLAQVAGLGASELHRLYMAKHEVNNQRQDNGYSQATKTEDDNKKVV